MILRNTHADLQTLRFSKENVLKILTRFSTVSRFYEIFSAVVLCQAELLIRLRC